MRLINAATLKLHEFPSDESSPPFAILSHTWGDEECTIRDMQDPQDPQVQSRAGFVKIKCCCELALEDGLEWAWVDTCCIDKSSSAELSEAINSMFRWYQIAKICYAYLSDVSDLSNVNDLSDLGRSRWFTRGWTLQELVAPKDVLFYSSGWKFLGSKLKLSEMLWNITKIDREVLATGVFKHVNIAARMAWAAHRQTTRPEDMAYCLMGIFDVNMPLLYGENKKAFIRLQEEIFKISDDQSVFAWGLPEHIQPSTDYSPYVDNIDGPMAHGMLADSPADFAYCHQIKVLEDHETSDPPMVTNSGVQVYLPVWNRGNFLAAAISCTLEKWHNCRLCIPLIKWSPRCYARWGKPVLVPVTGNRSKDGKWADSTKLLIAPGRPTSIQLPLQHFDISKIPTCQDDEYVLEDVYCLPHAQYLEEVGEIMLSEAKGGPHAAVFFIKKHKDTEVAELKLGKNTARIERNIINKARKESLAGSHARITKLEVSELNSRRPKFAVLLGGDTTDSGTAWSKFIHIREDDGTDEEIHQLLQRKTGSFQLCMTKIQLISILMDDSVEKSLLRNRGIEGKQPEMIQYREVHCKLISNSHARRHQYSSKVFVDIGLQPEWRNIVLKSIIVVSVNIYAQEHLEEKYNTLEEKYKIDILRMW